MILALLSGLWKALRLDRSIVQDGTRLELQGDSATPGNSKYYGTDGTGAKGFHALPEGGGGGTLNGLSDVVAPSPIANDSVRFNGSNWVNSQLVTTGGSDPQLVFADGELVWTA